MIGTSLRLWLDAFGPWKSLCCRPIWNRLGRFSYGSRGHVLLGRLRFG
jgi:hypothetical protein